MLSLVEEIASESFILPHWHHFFGTGKLILGYHAANLPWLPFENLGFYYTSKTVPHGNIFLAGYVVTVESSVCAIIKYKSFEVRPEAKILTDVAWK
jgi:hypothetical protein